MRARFLLGILFAVLLFAIVALSVGTIPFSQNPRNLTAQVSGGGGSVPLTVKETEGVTRTNEPVRNAVPLPKSAAFSTSNLSLRNSSGTAIPAQFSTVTTWPDGSIRWVEAAFIEPNLPANSQTTYTLAWQGGGNPSPAQPLSVQNSGSGIVVSAGPYEYSVDAASGKIFNYARANGRDILPGNSSVRRLELTDSTGALYTSGPPSQVTVDTQGPLMALVTMRGAFQGPSGTFPLTYILRMRFWATGRVEMSLLYEHNNGRSIAVAASARFKSADLVTDISMPGTARTLRLSEHFTDSNYTSESYHLAQDATPYRIDWSVAPGFGVQNALETSSHNELDNNYLKIRNAAGALVYNQGGVSLGDPVGNNPAQGTPGGMSQAGLFELTNGADYLTLGINDFWEKAPKSYEISPLAGAGNYKLKVGFFPRQNGPFNDFTHAQGPILYTVPGNPANYDIYGGTDPSLIYAPDTQNYNFISGKGIIFRFGMTLEPLSGAAAQNFALGIKTPLYALAPGNWYGPNGADALGSLYVESRGNWASDPKLGTLYGPFADRLDRWGRALYDPSSTCAAVNPTFGCITLEERLHRGNDQGLTRQQFGIWLNEQIDWGGGDPINESYGTADWAIQTALRESDPRGITHVGTDMWGIQNIWHYPASAAQQNTLPRLMIEYQKGYFLSQSVSSPRHGLFYGLSLNALIKNDPDMRESMIRANWYGAGGYPVITISQALARAPWRDLTQYYNEGVAHRGKIMANLVAAYRLTGDRNYLDIAKQYILYTKPFLDACETRFGTPWAVATALSNTSAGGGNETQCILQNGDTYSGAQPFMVGYFNDGLVRVLDALKEVDGGYDPTLYPWALHYLNEMYKLVIHPYVPTTPNGTATTPKMIFFYKGTSSPPASLATSMCASEQAVFNGTIAPAPGGTEAGFLVFCGNISYINNSLFMPGMAWLYHQTGNPQMLDDLLREERLIFLGSGVFNFGDDIVTFRNQNYGAADVKIASELHDSLPMLAAAVLPAGSATIPPFGGGGGGGNPPPTPTAPATPSGFAATASASTVVLNWQDVSNETSYAIERRTGTGSYSEIATVGANVTSYTDSTVAMVTAYTYRIRAQNSVGYSGYSAEQTVTVPDSMPPSVTMASPLPNSAVSGTIIVSATASDNVGVAGVQFLLDGAALGGEDTAAPYAIPWVTTSTANGSHILTARARDAAGNTAVANGVTVTVQNITSGGAPHPPSVSITQPAPGATVSGVVSLQAIASVSASDLTATAIPTPDSVSVQFLADGAAVGPEIPASPYSTAWNTAGVTNGTHTIGARAQNSATGATALAIPVTVSVQNAVITNPPPNLGGGSGGSGGGSGGGGGGGGGGFNAPGGGSGTAAGLTAPGGNASFPAPAYLRAGRVGVSQIRLTWVDTTSNEQAFTIERSTTGSSDFTELAIISANHTRYDDTGTQGNRAYWYRVKASSILQGSSEYSNVVSIPALFETIIPAAPAEFNVILLSPTYPTGLRFVWNDLSAIEDRIELHLSTDGTTFRKVNQFTDQTHFSYSGAGLDAGKRYYYEIRACKGTACSPFSAVVSALIPSGATAASPSLTPQFNAPSVTTPPPPTPAASGSFTRTLQLGSSGADVRRLQRCLNQKGFAIAASGPGSPGNESIYFGERTRYAVFKFQNAHAAQILTPAGLTQGTGVFGQATRAYMSTVCAP